MWRWCLICVGAFVPLSVVVERGRWFLISVDVRPGMVASSSLWLSALGSVTDGGEHMHWWMYWTYSAAGDAVCGVDICGHGKDWVWSLETGGSVPWALGPLRGTIPKPVLVHLCPQMIVRPGYTSRRASPVAHGVCVNSTSGGGRSLATPAYQGRLALVSLSLGAAITKINSATLTLPSAQGRPLARLHPALPRNHCSTDTWSRTNL